MHALLGYLLCLVVLTPAFSVDVFFALIGATSRLHDLLAIVRAVSRMLQSVTSPFKIALTVAVLIGVFASDSPRTTRGFILLVASAAGAAGMLHAATFTYNTELQLGLALAPWVIMTALSLPIGSRLVTGSTA
jgi:hypothetical protein